MLRDIEAQRFSGLNIYDELVFRRRLHGKIRWLFPFENAVGVNRSKSKFVALLKKDASKVSYREVPLPSMLDALKNGQVDAAVLVDPFLTIGLGDPMILPASAI